MSEVPHCPDCNRAGCVKVRSGPGYEYYCRNCHKVFDADDATDAAWIDMVSNSMFRDIEKTLSNATHDYSDECECEWCEKGRPGMEDIEVSE